MIDVYRKAGLRLAKPAHTPKPTPHVQTVPAYRCSQCGWLSPRRQLVREHIRERHPKA